MYTQENLANLKKDELVEIILKLQSASSKNGRKEQVLNAILDGPKSLTDIIEFIGDDSMDTRNVSSQLTYLKKDGIQLMQLPDGRRFIPGQTKGFENFTLPV